MSLNFTAVNTSEHDNGAALGSLSHENATVGSFKLNYSGDPDYYYVDEKEPLKEECLSLIHI